MSGLRLSFPWRRRGATTDVSDRIDADPVHAGHYERPMPANARGVSAR
jgi:hypothetical protein